MAIFTAIFSAVSTAVAFAIATVGLATVVQLTLGAALLIASVFLAPRPPRFYNPAPEYQAVINQSAASRRRGYGLAKIGGVRAFYDSKDGTLYQIVMMHQGEVDEVVSIWMGDKLVDRNESLDVITEPIGFPTGGAINRPVNIKEYLGTADQTADALMLEKWDDVWTANHRLRGIAYLRAKFDSPVQENYLKIFPEGANTPLRAICKLSKVYDPRTETTAWSDNPALCLRDYLIHPDGYAKLTADDINEGSFEAFADLSDEAVALAQGGTEKRYRVSGMYELNDNPTDVVGRFLAACDAELYTDREGKLAMRGGEWDVPTVTLDPSHIISHDLEEGADALDRFNRLKIVYTSPLHDFQPTEAQPWDDLADQAVRAVQSQDFSVDMCPSPSQARRLAKIFRAKANPKWRGTIRTDLYGLKLRGERTMQLVLPELEIDESFLILSHDILLDSGLPVGCALQVTSLDASAYEWSTEEQGTDPPPPQNTAPALVLPVPANLTLTVERREVQADNLVSVVVAEVDSPSRANARLEAQIRRDQEGAPWENMSVATGEMTAVSGALIDGETYFVRARFVISGVVGDWTAEDDITVVTNTTAPDIPASLTSELIGDDVRLEWFNPATNFYRSVVYRNSTATFGSATQIAVVAGLPGEESAYVDVNPGVGTWYYWVTARNQSGIEGDPAGPVDEEITA